MKPVFDFDHYSQSYAENWAQLVRDLHALDFPLAWSNANGGYWVVGSWAEAKRVVEDWETFSADNDPHGERRGGKGSRIPQNPYPLILSESDPPLHSERRKIELPFFVPKALRGYEAMIDQYVDDAIRGIGERTEADLLWDLILPITARTTFALVGYGDAWSDIARSVHLLSYMTPEDPAYPVDVIARIQSGFRTMIAERRIHPKSDIATALAQGVVMGRPLTDEEGESMLTALVFGGFDTVTTAAINALIWLEGRSDLQQKLLAEPKLLDNAIEEWLRVWPPAQGIGRTVMRDIDLGGRQLRAGERIYVWFAAANRDPAKFANAEEVQIDRADAKDHLAFSGGVHRCLGALLAKLELRAMIRAIVTRMPNYQLDRAGITRLPTFRSVAGYLNVPMRMGKLS